MIKDNIIILCVEFTDITHTKTISEIYNTLFSGLDGSLNSYFNKNSYGKYNPSGQVLGWYNVNKSYSYYGYGGANGTQLAYELLVDTLNIASNDINWILADADNDNLIHTVIIICAGHGFEYIDGIKYILGGKSISPYISQNNKTIRKMALISETSGPYETIINDSTHELIHAFGVGEIYANSWCHTRIGEWSSMAIPNGETTSINMDAYSKMLCGYLTVIKNPSGLVSLKASDLSDIIIKYTTDTPDEYFIIENRQKRLSGIDSTIPGSGLLIYKIKENTTQQCCYARLIAADGYNYLNDYNYGRAEDAFPGLLNLYKEFGYDTSPSNNMLCDGTHPIFKITNISNSKDIMTFNSLIECSNPICSINVS